MAPTRLERAAAKLIAVNGYPGARFPPSPAAPFPPGRLRHRKDVVGSTVGLAWKQARG